jgi:heparin binding hemagglutinin HbhA
MPQKTEKKSSNIIDDLKSPIYAAFGVGELALAAVSDIVEKIRDGVESSTTGVREKIEEARDKYLTEAPSEPAKDVRDVIAKFSPDELRKVAEAYSKVALDIYNYLAERGEEATKRLRKQQAEVAEEAKTVVSSVVKDVREMTDQTLGKVASQTRALGEKAAAAATEASLNAGIAIEEAGEKAIAATEEAGQRAAAHAAAVSEKAATRAEAAKPSSRASTTRKTNGA